MTDRNDRNDKALSPWLTLPLRGVVVFEGRARLPEGYGPPTERDGVPVTWRREGDLWHFRGEFGGNIEDAQDVLVMRWLDEEIPERVDRVTWFAPPRLELDEQIAGGARAIPDEEGRPVAFVVGDPKADDGVRALAERGIKHTFGGAVTIGPWQRTPEGFRAEVTAWHAS